MLTSWIDSIVDITFCAVFKETTAKAKIMKSLFFTLRQFMVLRFVLESKFYKRCWDLVFLLLNFCTERTNFSNITYSKVYSALLSYD